MIWFAVEGKCSCESSATEDADSESLDRPKKKIKICQKCGAEKKLCKDIMKVEYCENPC